MMKEETHIFQGMKRDVHQIRQDGKFLWNAHNIRITNREDNTLLSITNERGPKSTSVNFEGIYVGHCIVGDYLVVFTATKDGTSNYIYRVKDNGTSYTNKQIYEETSITSGGWSPDHPIEAIGVYETELVQKVYWVDGVNQPRVINVAKPESLGKDTPPFYTKGEFDFVRTLALKETVKVHKSYGSGSFSPGVIQYAMSYYCKNGQESNIFYTTPLQYISHRDRGGSPEETVGNSFLIKINNVDTNFDYLRLYSIHRTSIDSTPTVKVVTDIQVTNSTVLSYLDSGTEGYTIDPMQLLYIGGETIIASTITSKDNTLFLGNLTINSIENEDALKKGIANNYAWVSTAKFISRDTESQYSTYYYYNPNLDGDNPADFATREHYRTGIQVQYKNGKWSSPIFTGDKVLRSKYPWDTGSLANAEIKLLQAACVNLRKMGAIKVRTCVVLPKLQDREVICQGILCPTVYWVEGRRNNSPHAMSSWFFRSAAQSLKQLDSNLINGANIQFEHNKELLSGVNIGAEIQNMMPTGSSEDVNSITSIDDTQKAEEYKSSFFVDENIVTFHSPDIEFDQNLWNYYWNGVKLRIVGIAELGAISGDIDIQTSTPSLGNGFTKSLIGYQTKNNIIINGGLVTTGSYEDNIISDNFTSGTSAKWAVYPWHRSGSLNNDTSRSEESGTRTSVLGKKKISNLRYFHKNNSSGIISPLEYDISTPQVHTGEDLSVLKLCPAHLGKDVTYMGNIDTLITAGQEYPIYAFGNSGLYEITNLGSSNESAIMGSKEPVRMKYKSTPHVVFSLGAKNNEIPILPRHKSVGGNLYEPFKFPVWLPWGSEDGSNDNKGEYEHIVRFALTSKDSLDMKGVDSSWAENTALIKNTDGTYSIYIAKISPYGKDWYGLNSTSAGKKIVIKKNVTYCENVKFNNLPSLGVGNYSGEDILYSIKHKGTTPVDNKFELIDTSSLKPMAPSNRNFFITRDTFGTDIQFLGFSYLLIGELYRDKEDNKFGGDSEEALSQNLWIPAGDPVEIPESGTLILSFKYGDTWYSRYDCLKTYPFTQEDENSIVDIGSFMLETRVNIDGRYDRNRGQYSNLNMTPRNFNLINPVYSQKDNFFNYRILDEDYSKQSQFKHQLTWTKEKLPGEKIDSWTNITLANTLDMNGTRGAITSLKTWNDAILCFQERGFSQVLFNSRVQIPVSDGVPIEISNGYKVEGSRYLSDVIGCANKWSIATTPYGVYFIDSGTESIYRYDGKLTNLSKDKGMDWWVRSINSANIWSPEATNSSSYGIRTSYDEKYGDVYFTPSFVSNTQPDALCYSESLEQFTSLMSYGGVAAMINYKNKSLSLYKNLILNNYKLYENFTGDYNNFFGKVVGWDFSFIANENPTYTKIFDTLDLRGDLFDKNGKLQTSDKKGPSTPITFFSVNNEYQNSGRVEVTSKNLRQKFRVWRGTIPRQAGTRERIRNPWAMITLGYNPTSSSDSTKAVIHDVTVKYTI